jgi:hypothetical protein
MPFPRCVAKTTLLLFCAWQHAQAFALPSQKHNNNSRQITRVFSADPYQRTIVTKIGATEFPSSAEEKEIEDVTSSNRRRFFLLGAGGGSLAAAAAKGAFSGIDDLWNRQLATIATTANNKESVTQTVSTVEEALQLIKISCDKRFLHAVVASDYCFLYPADASSDFLAVDPEEVFSVVNNSNNSRSSKIDTFYKMAATGDLASKRAPSLWPLEPVTKWNEQRSTKNSRIHFAWPQEGGLLTSELAEQQQQLLVVDGIDCGKMSLEDALERNMQVLVQAPSFLIVPHLLEKDLKDGLKGAFFI